MTKNNGFSRCPDSVDGHNFLIVSETMMICLNCKMEVKARDA